MVRNVHRLTALAVKRAKARGFYADGGGLYLLVSDIGAKSWVLRFLRHGKAYMRGLGSAAANAVSLASARDAAAAKQTELAAGRMPLGKWELRRIEKAKAPPACGRES